MRILTHRGLEPQNTEFSYSESTLEAFGNQLSRGFWIEFDVSFSQDRTAFVFHDDSANRISKGVDNRKFIDIPFSEISDYSNSWGGTIATLESVFRIIEKRSKEGQFSALHVKSRHQGHEDLDVIIQLFQKKPESVKRIFLFDLKPESAEYMKENIANIKIFASVSHPYDVQRFSSCVGETLITPTDFFSYHDLYDGVWLDEWDRKGINWTTKKLYEPGLFEQLRSKKYLIGLVTPELHAISPGLYGGEFHEDCLNQESLVIRSREIANLNPDFICTDNPQFFS